MLIAITLAVAWAFVLAHGPAAAAVAAVLLSSFITAATEHPDVVPSNILHVLQFVAQLLSFLTPKGSVSAFKFPLTVTAAPSAGFAPMIYDLPPPEKKPYPPSAGLVRYALLWVIAAFALTAACASVFGSTIASDELACLGKVASDVEQRAAAVLLAGGANFDTQVAGLIADLGKDGALCAIEAAVNDFEAQQSAVPDAGSPGMNALVAIGPKPDYAGAIARGKATAARLRGR